MLYAILSEDVPNSLPLRQSCRPAHLKRLTDLQQDGKLVLAGPHPAPNGEGYTGSLIVAQFTTYAAAKLWANSDPYFTKGVYAKVSVLPFKQVFPQAPKSN